MQRVVAAEYHASGHRKRTVEPRIEYRASVHFGIEFDYAAVAHHTGMRLYAETGRIAVGGDYLITCVRLAGADTECEHRRTVFHHIIFAATLERPSVGSVQTRESGIVKHICHVGRGIEIAR